MVKKTESVIMIDLTQFNKDLATLGIKVTYTMVVYIGDTYRIITSKGEEIGGSREDKKNYSPSFIKAALFTNNRGRNEPWLFVHRNRAGGGRYGKTKNTAAVNIIQYGQICAGRTYAKLFLGYTGQRRKCH